MWWQPLPLYSANFLRPEVCLASKPLGPLEVCKYILALLLDVIALMSHGPTQTRLHIMVSFAGCQGWIFSQKLWGPELDDAIAFEVAHAFTYW